ncbi:unnamed protein product [Prunus armeniaca]
MGQMKIKKVAISEEEENNRRRRLGCLSAWVRSPLGFQGFDAAGLLHKGEAPPTFFPGFPMDANRGKGELTNRFVQRNFRQRLNTMLDIFVEYQAGLFLRFWVSGNLFFDD